MTEREIGNAERCVILNSPVKKNNQLLDRAKELRREMTPQERKLWYCFLRRYPVKIYKQRIIDSFIADFYCASARLVIEVDGSQHYTEDGMAYDTARTKCLEKYDLKVIRFSNREIDRKFQAVCNEIDKNIQERRKEYERLEHRCRIHRKHSCNRIQAAGKTLGGLPKRSGA